MAPGAVSTYYSSLFDRRLRRLHFSLFTFTVLWRLWIIIFSDDYHDTQRPLPHTIVRSASARRRNLNFLNADGTVYLRVGGMPLEAVN